jgi:hypothetical protein
MVHGAINARSGPTGGLPEVSRDATALDVHQAEGELCIYQLSIALNAEGLIQVNATTYSEPKCAHGHARGAESLANWLWRQHLGRPRIFKSSAKAKLDLDGKNGIIFSSR